MLMLCDAKESVSLAQLHDLRKVPFASKYGEGDAVEGHFRTRSTSEAVKRWTEECNIIIWCAGQLIELAHYRSLVDG